jgi:hypothetical protein
MIRQDANLLPMGFRLRFLLVITLLIITVHRLPAPISEESTPPPKPAATLKPRPKVVAPKPKPTPISFAGTWSGVTNGACSNDGINHSGPVTFTVSGDERIVSWQAGTQSFQNPCYRNGDTLRFDITNDAATSSNTLRMSRGGKSVSYLARSTITTWPLEGTVCTSTGVLTKR